MTQLRVLGSGDAFGSGGRLQTCLHLSTQTAASFWTAERRASWQ